MQSKDIEKTGTFKIGGEVPVHRLGFGTMRLTGPEIWGGPADEAEAIRTLKCVAELGIDFIDTADSYGPDVTEPLIRKALHPYDGVLVATKAGFSRPGKLRWVPLGRPDYLIQQAYKSCRILGVEQIGLWQLHRIDPRVPRDEQFGAIREMLDAGIIRHAGLSQVGLDDIRAAEAVFPVATVQNHYSLADRSGEDVLNYCESRGIGFIPWFPLASGNLAKPGSLLDAMAAKYRAKPAQIALAWMLKRSPVMLPIPGTTNPAHLRENAAAGTVALSDADFAALDKASAALPSTDAFEPDRP